MLSLRALREIGPSNRSLITWSYLFLFHVYTTNLEIKIVISQSVYQNSLFQIK